MKRGTIERLLKKKQDVPKKMQEKAAVLKQLKERVQQETDRVVKQRAAKEWTQDTTSRWWIRRKPFRRLQVDGGSWEVVWRV